MLAPSPEQFESRLRSPAVAARVGLWLGICFGICFLTGLISHYAQEPQQWFPFPTRPSWGYRLTQGLHVTTGVAAIPLLLVKLWAVYPKLFERPPSKLRELMITAIERGSIAVLVAASIFMLASGLLNSAQWYPWDFSFRTTHYAVAWVAIGALIMHIAVKLPIIANALRGDVEDIGDDRSTATREGALTRRGLLRTTWAASGIAILATVGGTVPWLRNVSVFAVRSGEGPQGIPINKTAEAAKVTEAMVGAGYALVLADADGERRLSYADLEAMPQQTVTLPIACVEGWSASGDWTGVRLSDLFDLDGVDEIAVTSLQGQGAFKATTLPANFARDSSTLVALKLNGEKLTLDHGYPCRLIAPNRPGVLQTKWLSRLEIKA